MIFLRQCDPVNGCGHEYPGDLPKCPKCKTDQQFSQAALINPRDYVYDIETYPNVFTCRFIHLATDQRWSFEISDRVNQINEFIAFCRALGQCGARGVGYNNEMFDYPVVHQIINNPWWGVAEIYAYAMEVIKAPHHQKYDYVIWDRERVFAQVDLYKIHHFDNTAKATALKVLEINMRMGNVSDLPFPVGTMLNHEEKDVLHAYNDDDCVATAFFYVRTLSMINLRDRLSESFGVNFTNKNDVKMGEMILVGEMEKEGIACYEKPPGGGRKTNRATPRASIDLNQVIFPYIKFERPEFDMVRGYLSRQTIYETKGVFTDITCTPDMLQYMDPTIIKVYGYKGPKYRNFKGERKLADHKSDKPVKLSDLPDGANLAGVRFESKNLHCVIDGFRYDFGTGGLHASVSSQIVITDDIMQIVDVDVASFYPNLGIKNRIYPEHLSAVFCEAYQGVYFTRKSYSKDKPENGAYKLALNGAYGGSNNEHSPFYDPMYTMKTTINGQLMLCMLVEQMIKIPGLSMIQCNTDGITYSCPKEHMQHQRAVCKWWEAMTCLELEEALYNRMFIRDVNSYMAEYESGKLKRIGAYAHVTPDEDPATRELAWHKNHSARVVPLVAQRVLVEGLDAKTLIEAHDDPFDFLIRARAKGSDRFVMRWPEYDNVEIPVQRTTRYFVSKTGGELMKVSKPSGPAGSWKRAPGVKDDFYHAVLAENNQRSTYDAVQSLDSIGVAWDVRIHTKGKSTHETREGSECAGWRVTDCADIKNFDRNQVNVDYYVAEVNKLVDPLL